MHEAAMSRLVGSPGLDADGLVRLQGCRIAVVGAGVLGGVSIQQFGLLQIPLTIIDCDHVQPENLGNASFPAASVGRPKAEVRADQLRVLNPDCPVRPVHARLEDLGLAALADCDLLVCGLDNRRSRLRLNELALQLGIPWVDAAVDGSGESLLGTVTVYDPRRADAACYSCKHDSSSLAAIAREEGGAGCVSWRGAEASRTEPTLQAASFGQLVGSLQNLVATRLLLGQAEDLVSSQLVVHCDQRPGIRVLKLGRNRRCLFSHERLEPLRPLPGQTVGALLELAAAELGAQVDELRFHNRLLVRGLRCRACGTEQDFVRIGDAITDAELRCKCGGQLQALELSDSVAAPVLAELAPWSWGEIGVPREDVVTAVAGDRCVHFIVNRAADAQGPQQEARA